MAFCGAPLGAIRGRGPPGKRGEHRQGDKILSRASIGASRRQPAGDGTQDNQDYTHKLHCNCHHSQRRRRESNPYVPWTGGNHRVSRVGWDEESGDDEGGHLHQGPHLIPRQGVAACVVEYMVTDGVT